MSIFRIEVPEPCPWTNGGQNIRHARGPAVHPITYMNVRTSQSSLHNFWLHFTAPYHNVTENYIMAPVLTTAKLLNLPGKVFFGETAAGRTGAMPQSVWFRRLREPHHTQYSPKYGDKGWHKKCYSSFLKEAAKIHDNCSGNNCDHRISGWELLP